MDTVERQTTYNFLKGFHDMSNELKAIRLESLEAELIMGNFAERQRVHLSKEISIKRFYNELSKIHGKLDLTKFYETFKKLADANYGSIRLNKYHKMSRFMPNKDIRDIGMASFSDAPPAFVKQTVVPVTLTNDVIVVVIKNGKPIRLKVAESDVDGLSEMLALR